MLCTLPERVSCAFVRTSIHTCDKTVYTCVIKCEVLGKKNTLAYQKINYIQYQGILLVCLKSKKHVISLLKPCEV